MNITIERYGARNWAVYVGEELLCVTVYLKGAQAVANALANLLSAISCSLNPGSEK